MKKVLIVFISLITLVFLVSCNGYNNIMIEHLENEENYYSVTGIINDIYFFDIDWKRIDWEDLNSEIPEKYQKLCFSLSFENEDDYILFSGTGNVPEDYQSRYFRFEVVKDNGDILEENDFFDIISIDDEITITTSNLIYMDGNFFEVVSLTLNNTVYLDYKDGFANLIEYMSNNKSIL